MTSKPFRQILEEFEEAMDEIPMSNEDQQQAQQADRQAEEEKLTRILSELSLFVGRDDCDVTKGDMRLLCAATGIDYKKVL